MKFEEGSNRFIRLCIKHEVECLLVGGAAVNFYGYKCHSADIDFWVKPRSENFSRLLTVLQEFGYAIKQMSQSVLDEDQNISIKISPEQEIEIITRFNPNKTFNEAFSVANTMQIAGNSN